MATLAADSFDVTAVGRQFNSKKETMPAFSFGTGSRETAREKVFISARHEKLKMPMASPGPIYNQPTAVGEGPKFSFGADEQRKHAKAKYPDSSVDLTGAVVDSQPVKFHSARGVHFGTEPKMSTRNAEIARVHPAALLGLQSPGALEYMPEKCEAKVMKVAPEYSFGPSMHKKDKKDKDKTPQKPVTRLQIPLTATPRHVGPGSHPQPPGLGQQPVSARASAPSYTFGASPQQNTSLRGQLLDISPELSSLGKQVVSQQRTMPSCSFGDATRDTVARTQVVMSEADRGPLARMPKPNFHLDLPKVPTGRLLAKPGL